jgi:hypothetical protein
MHKLGVHGLGRQHVALLFWSLTQQILIFFLCSLAVDYRCDDRMKVGELRGDIGATRYVLAPSFSKPRPPPPQKTTRLARRYFWRYRILTRVLKLQIPNGVVGSQFLTSLLNGYSCVKTVLILLNICLQLCSLMHLENQRSREGSLGSLYSTLY